MTNNMLDTELQAFSFWILGVAESKSLTVNKKKNKQNRETSQQCVIIGKC